MSDERESEVVVEKVPGDIGEFDPDAEVEDDELGVEDDDLDALLEATPDVPEDTDFESEES